jgi:hypothetical protein
MSKIMLFFMKTEKIQKPLGLRIQDIGSNTMNIEKIPKKG